MRFTKLMKDNYENKISGVLSGIGKYFGINVMFLRILFILLTLFSGIVFTTLFYFILSIFLMDKFDKNYVEFKTSEDEIKINKDYELKEIEKEKKKKTTSTIFKDR